MILSAPQLFAATACLGLLSCGAIRKGDGDTAEEEQKQPIVAGPELVGRIASVPADKRFVLIQSYGKWRGETGQILTTRGPDERTANLRTTGEKLGEFAAADVQSGTVEPGDAVYFQHVPKPVTPLSPAETSQTEENALIEDVQKNN